ncbi:MAG: tRNA (adenosine(37)-N6)-threonylcarbamoyltransferase complex ATPase subunit type 1 TsaE [Bacteroidales bacterium]|nr:tRNA (adenosine(37)-N6)-threonylcarbamoyltransferase complex ATPase subunit type 1 TsaE [Bacteroidales bacterium]
MKTFDNISLAEIPSLTAQILELFPNQRLFILDAPMGGGKTTFIRSFCTHLGVDEEVTSPTFAIVNVYEGEMENEIYHFDFYRLEKVEDAFQIGFYEYTESGNYCFIEWPEIVMPYLSGEKVVVKITLLDNPDLRNVEVKLG